MLSWRMGGALILVYKEHNLLALGSEWDSNRADPAQLQEVVALTWPNMGSKRCPCSPVSSKMPSSPQNSSSVSSMFTCGQTTVSHTYSTTHSRKNCLVGACVQRPGIIMPLLSTKKGEMGTCGPHQQSLGHRAAPGRR